MSRRGSFGIATGSYVVEREDWREAVERATREGWPYVELTAMSEERLDALLPFLARHGDLLETFGRVSVHAPVLIRTSAAEVATKLAALPAVFDVVCHPDVFAGQDGIAALGRRVLFENMDSQKTFGRTAGDLRSVFAAHPEAGFCLDVAHCWTNDPSLGLAHELLDAFGERLRQLHVSGIEPGGTHRPTTAADLELYDAVLGRCRPVPWLLEAELA